MLDARVRKALDGDDARAAERLAGWQGERVCTDAWTDVGARLAGEREHGLLLLRCARKLPMARTGAPRGVVRVGQEDVCGEDGWDEAKACGSSKCERRKKKQTERAACMTA